MTRFCIVRPPSSRRGFLRTVLAGNIRRHAIRHGPCPYKVSAASLCSCLPGRLRPHDSMQIFSFGGIRRSKGSIGVLDHVQHPQYLRLQARVTTGSPQELFGLVEINASHRFHRPPPSNGLATTYGLSPRYFRRLRISPSFHSFAQQGYHQF